MNYMVSVNFLRPLLVFGFLRRARRWHGNRGVKHTHTMCAQFSVRGSILFDLHVSGIRVCFLKTGIKSKQNLIIEKIATLTSYTGVWQQWFYSKVLLYFTQKLTEQCVFLKEKSI